MGDRDIDGSDLSISDQEREYAQSALTEFNKGNFSACLQNLGKLESRLTDPKVSHNKAVAEFYKSDQKKIEAFKKNLNNVFAQGKLKQDVLEDVEQCVFHYNQAILLYHQKKYTDALRIVDRIYKFIEPMDEQLAKHVCLLLIDLNILTQQQNKALTYIECIENQFVNTESKENDEKVKEKKDKILDASTEQFRTKLMIYRAKCYLMSHTLKSAKREIKNVAATEGQNTSTLCLRAHLEYLKGNFKNAIKIFNSSPTDFINIKEHGESATVIFYNNMGVIHHAMGKTNLACHYFKQALKEDQIGFKLYGKSENGELNRPLYTLGSSRYHEIMYNLGIALLHAGQASQAFDCLIIAAQRYHRNSRLWLRIAECCIQVHKNGNENDFNLNKRQKDIVDHMVGSGKHRKVVLTSHLSKDMKYSTESQTFAVPVATLEFASLCLRNAIVLLPSETTTSPVPVLLLPGGVQPPPPPPSPGPAPSSPLTPQETESLKNSVLIASAYVSLCLGDYVLTLEHAQTLLTQNRISGAHRLLGHLYAAEALVLMDKVSDAIEHLNPDNISDISLTIPKDDSNETEDISTNTRPPIKWFPENLGTAFAVLQYNLAVALTIRGATKEIGTALTRICLRHKAVEARMKTFTSAIMDCLVVPLQEKLEDWKKAVFNLDKEHAKDYKRARAELKKRSTDTLRLQKKARKGGIGSGSELQRRLECNLQDVTERRQLLEETEKQAVRAALVEERSRFCLFVGFLKPVVNEEVAMLSELTHLQEVVDQLQKHTADPFTLPPASEQVIADLKNSDSGWSFQTPPSSPSSLGSRKSSMCSISSLNSSSSGSSKSHHSPSHPHWHRSLSQPVARCNTLRLTSVSSRDSGFTSQDTLFPATLNLRHNNVQVSNMSEHSNNSSNSSTPCTPFPATTIPNSTATWPNLQETLQFERAASAIISDRPHTISSAYEKGHQRPPLTVYTFQAPEQSHSQPVSPVSTAAIPEGTTAPPHSPIANNKTQLLTTRPPLPTRCSSLERPSVPAKSIAGITGVRVLPVGNLEHKLLTKPTPLPAHIAKDMPQPMYVNMHELASMAASKAQEMNLPPPPPEFTNPASDKTPTAEGERDGSTSESSLESSSGYGSQTTFSVEDTTHQEDVCNLETAGKYCTLPRSENIGPGATRRRPVSMTVYSSNTMRNTLLRRSSIQGNKPPPPIRRTASITNTNRSLTPVGSLENLPPPPAFLLENSAAGSPPIRGGPQTNAAGVNVLETVKVLTELKHTPASPNSVRRMSTQSLQSQQIQQLQQQFQQQLQQQQLQQQQLQQQQQQQPVLSSFQSPNAIYGTLRQDRSNTIYAQPSQLVPGSPSAIRRSSTSTPGNRSQSAERKIGEGPGGVGSGFIAALSAKLHPSLSPRNSRRHSEDLGPQCSNIAQPQPKIVQRGPGQGFLDTLNAKLAQQHLTNAQGQLKANKIRQIINSKAQPDPTTCHESLMDQIKRGATLKKARSVNDRSAPKIY